MRSLKWQFTRSDCKVKNHVPAAQLHTQALPLEYRQMTTLGVLVTGRHPYDYANHLAKKFFSEMVPDNVCIGHMNGGSKSF